MTVTGTKVVNINSLPGKVIPDNGQYVYIGRSGHGQSGYFGNPIVPGKPCPECGRVHNRGETLVCYEEYLRRRVQTDPIFRDRVRNLKNKILVCFCKPNPCHGDILSRVAEELSPSDSLGDNKQPPASTGDKEAHMDTAQHDNLESLLDSTDPFELLELPIEKLKERAKTLGIKLKRGMDKASIIEVLVEASMTKAEAKAETKAQHEVRHGVLFALHTRDENAKELIKQARERIQMNEYASPPRLFRLILRNKDGELYSRTVPGVRVSKERLPAVLRLVVLPPDESQKHILEALKKSPEAYEQPTLVRVARKGKDDTVRSYVMLYVRPKTSNTAEAVF